MLCRLYEPQSGQILIDDIDIKDIPIATLRNMLGVVLQDTFIFSGNVADNLKLNANIDNLELENICKELGLILYKYFLIQDCLYSHLVSNYLQHFH